MTIQIDQYQGITLYAFFKAVAQQTAPLPEDLKQKMSTVGEMFATDNDTDIDRAINQLANLAEHPRLEPLYTQIRKEIQPDYEPEELNENLLNPKKRGQKVINQPVGILLNIQSVLKSPDLLLDDSQVSSELRQAFRPNETTN
jgi:hypothetical protein